MAQARSKDVLTRFEEDCKRLSHERIDDENRRVFFYFLSDPYQPLEAILHITRQGIQIASKYGIKVDVLTKGDKNLIVQDFQLMREANTHFGMTLSFINDESRKEWEPMASSVQDRMETLKKAHDMGIYTWVSMEPVIKPDEALEVIRQAHGYVDFWKVGKLNHHKDIEQSINWTRFREDAISLLTSFNCKYYIKEDLRNAV
jgi:DNA repair photolyase